MSTAQATPASKEEKLTYAELVFEIDAILFAAERVEFHGLTKEKQPAHRSLGQVIQISEEGKGTPIVLPEWIDDAKLQVQHARRLSEFSEPPLKRRPVQLQLDEEKPAKTRLDALISRVEHNGNNLIGRMQTASVERVRWLLGDQPSSRYLSAKSRLRASDFVAAHTKTALLARGKVLREQWRKGEEKAYTVRGVFGLTKVSFEDWKAQLLLQARAQVWVDDAEAALVAARMSLGWAELQWLDLLTVGATSAGIALPNERTSLISMPGTVEMVLRGQRPWAETESQVFTRKRPDAILKTAIESLAKNDSQKLSDLLDKKLPDIVTSAITNKAKFHDVFRQWPSEGIDVKLQPIRNDINGELPDAESDDEDSVELRKTPAADFVEHINDIGALVIKYYATMFQYQLFLGLGHPGYTNKAHSLGAGGAHGGIAAAISARTARRYNI